MIEGSCLCGGMKFEIDEEYIFVINNCHCANCRKVSGAAYGTFVQIPADHFRWLKGRDLLSTYESSPGNHRAFCKVCGSRAPQSPNWDERVTIPAGCLDGDPKLRPAVNIFTASKAPWHTIDEPIPSFDDHPPDAFWLSTFAEWQKRVGG